MTGRQGTSVNSLVFSMSAYLPETSCVVPVKTSRNAFAFIRNVERQAGLAFERLSGALDFSPF